ncbi:C-terminal of NADH-ubiquinone oxidoreductase 21 kDa subunit-domain-containing protein [Kockovaella imperatae]|uniref:C-terminal of NADH-ubiquinone oxidoreductase 21 kDa subunit-domain-containing protein n=1 Tax=Kockovaella imperatae TaxID=4999 RepID=A0A1Y1UL20_9TREE|nr:C-terminal of NADH-ubiquinone oxidoreductase 21 kDa subunit-domain-containing protein [Kockovaella imperatae]ORX38247.1 C-terminal of NADH-ubiquinone oxidoreductase 21 kDa subunit-domain-containing protein [Kockovaella imperatae]
MAKDERHSSASGSSSASSSSSSASSSSSSSSSSSTSTYSAKPLPTSSQPVNNWLEQPDPRTPHTRARIPIHKSLGDYPLIDIDPHVGRVIRYMRASDWAGMLGMTTLAPFLYLSYNRWDTTSRFEVKTVRSAIRVNALFGFFVGFSLAYMESSKRFWGASENSREVKKDFAELSNRAQKGLPIYGSSSLSPYMQAVAARNSTFSQFMMVALPWFNVVNHPYHGVETAKYYRGVASTQES